MQRGAATNRTKKRRSQASRRLPVDFKALIRRLTVGGSCTPTMIPLASDLLIRSADQIGREGLLESALQAGSST